MLQSAATPPAPPRPIASEAEAAQIIARIAGLMTELCDIVEQETALVRCGRLSSAAAVSQKKSDIAREFVSYAGRVEVSTSYLTRTTPKLLEALRRQHEEFRAKLQVNLTVLGTARAVSEGILRGVSNELSRRSAPQTYGATGRPYVPNKRAATPIAVSRSL